MASFFASTRLAARASLLVLLSANGCLAAGSLGKTSGTGGAGGDTTTSTTSSFVTASSSGAGGSIDVGTDGGTSGQIYVHDLFELYLFEPISSQLTDIGPFDCVLAEPSLTADWGMHDIAVDKNGLMYGVAKIADQGGVQGQNHVIVSIDPKTGKCTKQVVIPKGIVDPQDSVSPRGLSFVPAGTIDPVDETLVALAQDGAYLKIDLGDKTATLVGNLNGGTPGTWTSASADIVSIIGDKTYVTAKQKTSQNDRLAIMDPVTGTITQDVGLTTLYDFGGLAYWGGTLYGFTTDGDAYAIDPKTAKTTPIIVNGVPPGIQYHGAGVTTAAPLSIPK